MDNIHFKSLFNLEAKSMISKAKRLKGSDERKYKALFGVLRIVSSGICAYIWSKIYMLDRLLRPKHLLWTLLFLKCYATEHVNEVITGADAKTFRKRSWRTMRFLTRLNEVCWSQVETLNSEVLFHFTVYTYFYINNDKSLRANNCFVLIDVTSTD